MSPATSVHRRSTALVAVLFLIWTSLAPATAFAQRAQPRGGGGPSGGSSGGGDRSGGGNRVGGGGSNRDGGRTTAPREGPRTASRPSAPRETAREAPSAAERPAEPSSTAVTTESSPRSATATRRARGDSPTVGHAVARRGPPPSAWDDHDHHYSYWPGYWYGFYPWGYGGFGLGYYGAWYGGYGYGSPYYWTDEGAIRLKVKPREASVFVDGYYVGRVDDFDGVFQRLRLDPGPHRIEVRADGYEPLNFEVRILPDRKITYEETLQPQR
jgi:hypothetical protein